MGLFLTLSWHYEICVKEFEEKCVKKMILSERSESIIFNIFTKNFSKFRTSLDLFFGSFDLYQDKRNEHKLVDQKQLDFLQEDNMIIISELRM
ncbi:MAG: hypothetical protein DRP50_07000 [Thermotoga sp.]|nr:MAG: hypothetical protein DRP50_07000 [Thermotoga sp.]